MTQQEKVRVLVHPVHDRALYLDVIEVLEAAVRDDPDHWDRIAGRASVIDHWGYHSDVLSSVVFAEEPGALFYRLSIRPGEHEVFDRLARLVIERLSPKK